MKQLSLFAMALLLAASIVSCKKDTTSGKVVFGNTHGMSITSYDSTFHPEQYGHFSWGNTVDLNGDGQNDVQFHSTSEILGGGILTELYCHEYTTLLGTVNNQEFSLLANNANSSFGDDDTFKCTNVKLRDGDKYYFPKDETKYIGFKIAENNKTRLGWMKVILHHDYVEILETAIQK